MTLPLVPLLVPLASVPSPGVPVDEGQHEKARGAYVHVFEVPAGNILVTEWNGVIHEVIYQTPLDDEAEIEQRNALLFEFYGEGLEWNNVLDNGFGITYRRAGMQRYALYSYAMDINTFGTMDFHQVKW